MKKYKVSPYQQRLVKMEMIVRSHKQIKFKDLVFEMFGGLRDTDKMKTTYLIGKLRHKLLSEKDELFYSVGGYHQIIDKPENFIELMNMSKKRTKHNMQAINRNIHVGLGKFPENMDRWMKGQDIPQIIASTGEIIEG